MEPIKSCGGPVAFGEGLFHQGNDETGYVIYIKDGAVHVAIRTGQSVLILKELPKNGITRYLNQWVTIDVSIKPETASLRLNRARVAYLPISEPPSGQDHIIRLGEHQSLPIALQNNTEATPTGFTGAISSLKILRQYPFSSIPPPARF